MRIFIACLLVFSLFILSGCTTTQKGMGFGALAGGVAGGAAGYFTADEDEETETAIQYAAIGAAAGAVVGGLMGYISEE